MYSTIVLPTFNEKDNIEPLCKQILDVLGDNVKIIVVDDNSPDGTNEIVETMAESDLRIKCIRRLSDPGLTKSLQAGIDAAKTDYVGWMDADLSMPTSTLKTMYCLLANDQADVVIGSRFIKGGKNIGDSALVSMVSFCLSIICRLFLGYRVRDVSSGFILLKRSYFEKIRLSGDYGEYFISLVADLENQNARIIEIPYIPIPRQYGESKTAPDLKTYVKKGIKYLSTVRRIFWQRQIQSLFPLRNRRTQLITILFFAGLIRFAGIDWGLETDPFHPDEHVVIGKFATEMYTNPTTMTYTWGGAFYFRIAYLVGKIQKTEMLTLHLLRVLNIAFSILTGFLLYRITLRLSDSKRMALIAVALAMFYPAHVVESHFARPDVLFTLLVTCSLYYLVEFSMKPSRKDLMLSSFFCGLAISTMMWGIVLIPVIFFGWVETKKFKKIVTLNFGNALSIGILGTLIGYATGSFESFVFWDYFLAAMSKTFGMHESSIYFPIEKIFFSSSYAFGLGGIVICAIGFFISLANFQRAGSLIFISFFIGAWILQAKQSGDTARYLLFLTPVYAYWGALSLSQFLDIFRSPKGHNLGVVLVSVFILFSIHRSMAYSHQMSVEPDIRYKTAADFNLYLESQGQPKQIICTTQTFAGDSAFQPRFFENFPHTLKNIQLHPRAKSIKFAECDYIITTNQARITTDDNLRAQEFFKTLDNPNSYELVLSEIPEINFFYPGYFLNFPMPEDYFYIGLSFFIYRKINKIS